MGKWRFGSAVFVVCLCQCGDPPLKSGAGGAAQQDGATSFGDAKLTGSDSTASADAEAAAPGKDAAVSPDAGQSPADTAACVPDCADKNKQCGNDGCGGSCGFCPSNALCSEFLCKPITGADACKATVCDKNATCNVGSDGLPQCVCNAGWEGDGKTCTETDGCKTANGGCDANATCSDKPGEPPKCTCKDGYTGDGKTCKDVDECAKQTAQCAPHAVCTNTPGSYECACDAGFSGDGLSGCKDIDECAAKTAKCGSDQVCDNTTGSYVCSCAPGYTKIPNGCQDIDECAAKPCDANAACKNAPGTYTCTCNAGWQGDGKTCTEVDLCKGITCGSGAVCKKGADGKAACVCAPGYVGDGKACAQAVVDIQLVGVLVAPLMESGDCWDSSIISGCTKPSQSALDAVAKAMTDLQAAVGTSNWAAKSQALETALQGINKGTAPPDAYGDAVLQPNNISFQLAEVGDSNAPTWSNAKWSKISLGPTTVLKVTLNDADLALDDEIGTAQLQIDALSQALAAGPVTVAVPVQAQDKQILALKIVVKAWKGCGDGKCDAPETAATCAADCATSGPKCGDAKCDPTETVASCPTDCKVLAGSCKAMCGKQSQANGCWCDDYCEKAGDCCADKAAMCTFGCKGKCGQKSQESDYKVCWCDDYCTKNNDCCKDKAANCP